MVGVGFTVIEKLLVIPLQVLEMGVTVNNAVMGILEVLVAENAFIFPVPEATNPIKVLLFDHW